MFTFRKSILLDGTLVIICRDFDGDSLIAVVNPASTPCFCYRAITKDSQ